ncbi:MAG: gliding motility-associated C-terminal domain-containing protein [Prolixibacteraceae bacterium]|nr:gliding motility-associated C-terminal domain-containing protein [Prolixibacteraceae bacterium]
MKNLFLIIFLIFGFSGYSQFAPIDPERFENQLASLYAFPSAIEEFTNTSELNNIQEYKIIRGKITDKDGNPIVQAVVQYNRGGRAIIGAVTDIYGAFRIKLETNIEILNFSKTGYQSKEVNIAGKEEIEITLEEGSDEIQIYNDPVLNLINDVVDPLIIVDGAVSNVPPNTDLDLSKATVEYFGKLLNIAPEYIKSIEKLEDSTTIATYGLLAQKYSRKNEKGIFVVTTERPRITVSSIHELRNFIAKEIRFPEKVRDYKFGASHTFSISAKMKKNGKGLSIIDRPESGMEIVDAGEIIVAEMPDQYEVEKGILEANKRLNEASGGVTILTMADIPYFENELIRVFGLPQVNIHELEGKYVKLAIQFVWENGRFDFGGIAVPHGFSPNGDGVHDVFEVDGLAEMYPDFNMKIFNKTGDLLWEYQHNGDPNSTPKWWNGKAGSEKAETGTYFYVIEFNGGSAKNQSGHFILAE